MSTTNIPAVRALTADESEQLIRKIGLALGRPSQVDSVLRVFVELNLGIFAVDPEPVVTPPAVVGDGYCGDEPERDDGGVIVCTTDHKNILVGYAGGSDAPGSFGQFIADQPIGAELLSVSGWVCRWTGEYVDHEGHRAARLERIRHTDGRTGEGAALIHTCLGNAWSPTGRYSFHDGEHVEVIRERDGSAKMRAVCTVHGAVGEDHDGRTREGREAAHFDAAEHARAHPPIDVAGWRTWPTARLDAALDRIDDSTALWDDMSDELAERDHEHQTRINNGGILP